jgi:hypothetical protein
MRVLILNDSNSLNILTINHKTTRFIWIQTLHQLPLPLIKYMRVVMIMNGLNLLKLLTPYF